MIGVNSVFSQQNGTEWNEFMFVQQNQSWENFVRKFNDAVINRMGEITIVHLGDSHIQGGYFTNQVRDMFFHSYPAMGRGFLFPYVLAKTNGPEDVKFTSATDWLSSKNNGRNSNLTGLAGYSFLCNADTADLTISFRKDKGMVYPFDRLRIFYRGDSVNIISSEPLENSKIKTGDIFDVAELSFTQPIDSVRLKFIPGEASTKKFNLFFLSMENSEENLVYHSIGVNGITYDGFSHLNSIPFLKELKPDCIIISLGTNDAYNGSFNAGRFRGIVEPFIRELKEALPGVCIIITAPGDHLLNRRSINPRIPMYCDLLQNIAESQNCVYWDFFRVMGGTGSSRDWFKKGWMYTDYVHLSKDGYKHQGELFYDAFMDAVNKTIKDLEK